MKKLTTILFLVLTSFTYSASPGLIFKENKGQWPEKVLFGTEILNTKFYVNKNSFNYCVYNPEEYVKIFGRGKSDEKPTVVHGHNYEVNFVGGDLTRPTKTKEQAEYYNYFLGKDKRKWASNVKAYGNLLFNEVYEGVDLKLYSNGINLKYDFIVKANANTNSIKLNFKYTDGIGIANDELVIKTSVGNSIEKAPFAYQIINGKQIPVNCKYKLLDDLTIGFSFPNGYNKNYELVIDPTVVVCSYSGASSYAAGDACTYDAMGNIYTGAEADVGYPTTPGAFQLNGHPYLSNNYNFMDIALSEYNSSGSSKLFSTYIGGNHGDYPIDIIVLNGEITIFGGSDSDTFPVTPNAMDTSFNSPSIPGAPFDFVVLKLNLTGTALLASTYIGGSGSESINYMVNNNWGWNHGEMACDNSGNIFIIGATNSPDFPTTAGAISGTLKGGSDAVVFKLNNTLSTLIYSTFLGGSVNESGVSIKMDGAGGVYCFGSTTSLDFPTTTGVINTAKNGFVPTLDLFVTHLDATGTTMIASTYLGTNYSDYASLMDIDNNNDIYLTGGISNPSSFITTPGCYSNANGSNFIYKINSSLSNIIYKTKFGYFISPLQPLLVFNAFKVDSCGKLYIAGFGSSSFPTTPNAFQGYGGGPTDLYMAVFNQNCVSLSFASFFGGAKANNWSTLPQNNPGECSGLADFDNRGNLYTAIAIPGGLPTTPNAYAMTWVNTSTISACNDAFLKVDMQTFVNANANGANITGCPPLNTQFVSTTNTGTSYWDLGDGTTSTLDTITHTYTNLGTYNVLLVVTDTNTCNRTDSIKSILNVINPTVFDLGDDIHTCLNTPTILQANVSAVTYSWSTGQTTPTISVNQIGTYTLTINNGGCNSSDEVNVIIGDKKLSERFPNVITPNGDNINDYIDLIKYNFEEVEFYVFDRWGRERYKITKPDEKWNPNDLNNGTYYYVVNYRSGCTGKFATDKGFISVFK